MEASVNKKRGKEAGAQKKVLGPQRSGEQELQVGEEDLQVEEELQDGDEEFVQETLQEEEEV